MKITYKALIEFCATANYWMSSDKDGKAKPETKLTYALRKVIKRAKPMLEARDEAVADIQVKHATEKDGVLLRDAKDQLSYSKAAFQARIADLRALDLTEVAIDPFYVVVPADLDPAFREAFIGYVFHAAADVEPVDAAEKVEDDAKPELKAVGGSRRGRTTG